MPPQLEKNLVVPTAWQDEALARDGVSIHEVERRCRDSDAGAIKSHPETEYEHPDYW